MHQKNRHIYLSETDATGFLYFCELLKIAQETFEEYLVQKGVALQQMIEQGEFLLPIVHAEADYSAPLRVGDQVAIQLKVAEIGTSSFKLEATFHSKGDQAGRAQIVHVAISPQTGKSIPLSDSLLALLGPLQRSR